MRTSRKAIKFLMVGVMLVAATAGAFAQGFGRMPSPRARTPGYGYQSMPPVASPMVDPYGNRLGDASKGLANPKQSFFGGMRSMGAGGYGAFHYFKYHKLSDENKAKVDKIIEDNASKILPLRNELRAEKLNLDNLLWSPNPDKAKIDETIAKIADIQKQIQEIRADSILEINKIFQSANS